MNPPRDDRPLRCGVRCVCTMDAYPATHATRYAWARSMMHGDGRVLDMGSGCGHGANILRYREYHGVDHSEEATAYAVQHFGGPGRTFTAGDAANPPAGPWDAIVAFEVLEHLLHPAESLAAWRTVLADDGRLFLSVPGPLYKQKADRHEFHVRDWTYEQLESALREAGFWTVWRFVQPTDTHIEPHAVVTNRPVCKGPTIVIAKP